MYGSCGLKKFKTIYQIYAIPYWVKTFTSLAMCQERNNVDLEKGQGSESAQVGDHLPPNFKCKSSAAFNCLLKFKMSRIHSTFYSTSPYQCIYFCSQSHSSMDSMSLICYQDIGTLCDPLCPSVPHIFSHAITHTLCLNNISYSPSSSSFRSSLFLLYIVVLANCLVP